MHCIKKELKNFEGVKTLLLDGNNFGDEGVAMICMALNYYQVEEIDLSNNQLSEASLIHLKELTMKNKNVKRIIFKKNNVSLSK